MHTYKLVVDKQIYDTRIVSDDVETMIEIAKIISRSTENHSAQVVSVMNEIDQTFAICENGTVFVRCDN